jgi:4a-hydroxytetrahydrobiopterin dehydratase
MPLVTPAALEQALRGLPDWVGRDRAIVKIFRHRTFPEAILFVTAVAQLAEVANHHPDVDIRYTDVTVLLTTHDAGGVTDRDLRLARQIETLRPEETPPK